MAPQKIEHADTIPLDTSSPINDTSIPSRLITTSESALSALKTQLSHLKVDTSTNPTATSISKNIPIYSASQIASFLSSPERISVLQDELHRTLHTGAGVFVLKSLYARDSPSLLRSTRAFEDIVADEARAGGAKGDHFATSGANSRVWNSLGKHAIRAPDSFVDYYANPLLPLVFETWLGPGWRATAQVNVVRPGGKAQVCHRDYHLGFMTQGQVKSYPRELQVASQFLTLQGAVAHSDMPEDSGPTRFLPGSQALSGGYVAYHEDDVKAFFERNWVALPLDRGDAVFFNPALMHAAGENVTNDVERSANLLQISAAFGKTMETLDAVPMVKSIWNILSEMWKQGKKEEVERVVRIVGEGYAFPTNLDRRQPSTAGMAPESEQDLMLTGLKAPWDLNRVVRELESMRAGARMT